jgi:mRNA-degrading endonuclease toxin of MazEF toxin-antitoxin module
VTYRRWDVVAVHYPFIEGAEAKKRPALIVSSDALRAAHGVYWAAMITTAKTGARPEDVRIADPRKVGLPEDCVVRVSRMTTVSDAQISHRLGAVASKERAAVQALLRRYIP